MDQRKTIYPSYFNPFLIKPSRPLPSEMAVIGAGTIGPDIAYYLKSGLPQTKLYLVDIADEPLKNAEKRFKEYAQKSIARKKMKEEQAKALLDNILYTTDYQAIKQRVDRKQAATLERGNRPWSSARSGSTGPHLGRGPALTVTSSRAPFLRSMPCDRFPEPTVRRP